MAKSLLSRHLFSLRLIWLRRKARDPKLKKFLDTHNDYFFQELGVVCTTAKRHAREILARVGIEMAANESTHYQAFAALALSGFKPVNILELGTNHGATTAFLAELYPEATVYTVELPPEDPNYARVHREGADRHAAILAGRLNGRNVVQLRINTLWILKHDLSDFDLIWLDAGHAYPEVAWDHFYCIQKLAPGGWLFTDDVRMPADYTAVGRKGLQPIYELVEYINARQPEKFRFLLKRETPLDYLVRPKYVGFMRKNSATPSA